MTGRWTWVQPAVLLAVHDEQVAEHGGRTGLRDAALLESVPARAQQLATRGQADVAALAAAYGFGLGRNRLFIDGNKRTAFIAVELFLALNGHELRATDHDSVMTMLALAAGEVSEDALAAWVRAHCVAA